MLLFIEEWGNIPVLGTAFPFGKFFNNTVALTYDVIGGGNIYNKVITLKEGISFIGVQKAECKGSIGQQVVVNA